MFNFPSYKSISTKIEVFSPKFIEIIRILEINLKLFEVILKPNRKSYSYENFQILFETIYMFNFPSHKIISKSFKDYLNWSHAWIQSYINFELLTLNY